MSTFLIWKKMELHVWQFDIFEFKTILYNYCVYNWGNRLNRTYYSEQKLVFMSPWNWRHHKEERSPSTLKLLSVSCWASCSLSSSTLCFNTHSLFGCSHLHIFWFLFQTSEWQTAGEEQRQSGASPGELKWANVIRKSSDLLKIEITKISSFRSLKPPFQTESVFLISVGGILVLDFQI